jgi:excisionase family DNA binding protein
MPKRTPPLDDFNSATIAAAARYLAVTRQTIYTWLAAGELTSHGVGARQRILRADLDRVKRRRQRAAMRERTQ